MIISPKGYYVFGKSGVFHLINAKREPYQASWIQSKFNTCWCGSNGLLLGKRVILTEIPPGKELCGRCFSIAKSRASDPDDKVYLDVEKTIQVEWSREDDYFEEKRKFMNLIAEIQTGIKGAEPLPQEFSKTEVVKQQISKKQKLRELQKKRQKESEW